MKNETFKIISYTYVRIFFNKIINIQCRCIQHRNSFFNNYKLLSKYIFTLKALAHIHLVLTEECCETPTSSIYWSIVSRTRSRNFSSNDVNFLLIKLKFVHGIIRRTLLSLHYLTHFAASDLTCHYAYVLYIYM